MLSLKGQYIMKSLSSFLNWVGQPWWESKETSWAGLDTNLLHQFSLLARLCVTCMSLEQQNNSISLCTYVKCDCFCLALIFWQCSPTVDTEECVAFWEQKDYMSSGVGFKTAWDVFVRREFWCAPFNLLRLKDEFTLWDHPYPFGTLMGIINSSGKSLQLLKCTLNLICAISMTHEQMRRKVARKG